MCEGKSEWGNSMVVVPKNLTTNLTVKTKNLDISSVTTISLPLVVVKKDLLHRYYLHAEQMIWSKDRSSN